MMAFDGACGLVGWVHLGVRAETSKQLLAAAGNEGCKRNRQFCAGLQRGNGSSNDSNWRGATGARAFKELSFVLI